MVSTINASTAVADAPPLIQELWLSPSFFIDDPAVVEMATALGLLDQLPAIFEEATRG